MAKQHAFATAQLEIKTNSRPPEPTVFSNSSEAGAPLPYSQREAYEVQLSPNQRKALLRKQKKGMAKVAIELGPAAQEANSDLQ